MAQYRRFIGKGQALNRGGARLNGDQRISDIVHMIVGINPTRNGQAQQLHRRRLLLTGFRVASQQQGADFHAANARPAQALKDVCMELESTEVGRLYDLDVLDAAGEKLSRPEMRRCLVCGGPVAVCSRSRAHGLDAICAETARRLAEFACTTLGNLAADALREEAALSPKPGLVDSRTNGAHTDMDLLLMLRSAETLRPWFCRMVRLGLDGAAPAQLQNAGRQAEAEMLQATGGVNTHKGALYALSLLLAAMGRHLSGAQESVFSLAAADAAALAPPVGTHGSQVRRRYGRPGAREEAMDGFPSLQALLQATRSQPPLGVLLWSMAHLSDSNLLYRGGEVGLAFAQNEAERILRLPQTQWEAELTALDAEMTRRNLSPGGSADLLALTLFFRSLDFWTELSV